MTNDKRLKKTILKSDKLKIKKAKIDKKLSECERQILQLLIEKEKQHIVSLFSKLHTIAVEQQTNNAVEQQTQTFNETENITCVIEPVQPIAETIRNEMPEENITKKQKYNKNYYQQNKNKLKEYQRLYYQKKRNEQKLRDGLH